MKNIKLALIGCCYLLLSFIGNNSMTNLKQTLKKTAGYYEGSKTLYMQTTVYGVPEKNSKGLVKLGNAEIHKEGYSFYSKGFGFEMYCDGKKAITIDQKKKTATLYLNFDAKKMLKEQSVPVDSMLKRITAADSIVQLKGSNAYRVFANKNKLSYTEMVFDEKEFFLKEYNYTINVPGEEIRSPYSLIKVKYEKVSRTLPRKTDFNIERFISGTGNKARANEKYLKGYKLKVKKYYYETSVE